MANASIVFHPGAAEDYEQAFAWYFSRNKRLASDFQTEIQRSLRLIAQNPLQWPQYDAERRRLIVRKFPYSIIYELGEDHIVVLAVAHGRRRPYYWRDRLP